MTIGIIYFSATGNTEKIGEIISSRIRKKGFQTKTINLANFTVRNELTDLSDFTGLIFGFPVWASVIPRVCMEWIDTLNYCDKWCATYFTYGGPTVGIAHYHTKLLLNRNGLKVLTSAEFLGKHTFNVAYGFNFLPERPNQDDFNVANVFADKLIELYLEPKKREIIIKKPKDADSIIKKLREFKKTAKDIVPSRYGKECRMCLTCEDSCPTNAFHADIGEAYKMKCISCMRCVTYCPDKAIEYRRDMTKVYENLKKQYKLTDEKLKNLESKISY
ncbi:MAG: hypothetical protein FK732_09395 [Asgard group archaeon]|nr:hypothetical protein [Asgard group archaeon]